VFEAAGLLVTRIPGYAAGGHFLTRLELLSDALRSAGTILLIMWIGSLVIQWRRSKSTRDAAHQR
jgi:hypothetical protein